MFEPEQLDCDDSNLLSTEQINVIAFPKRFSRNPSVLENQLKELLKSIERLRPLSNRHAVMPGIKNFVDKQRNLTDKNVRNICYMNSIIFFLSSIDEVVSRALSYLKTLDSSWTVENLLEDGRKRTKTPTSKALLICGPQLDLVQNLCTFLVTMRSTNLLTMMHENYNYKEDRVIVDPSRFMWSFFESSKVAESNRGNLCCVE
jgi:hypothetical protein